MLAKKKDNTYNGWTNYATWRIKLELIDNYETLEHLAPMFEPNHLKEYCEEIIASELNYKEGTFVEAYALTFLLDVNWHEISEHLQTDYIAQDMGLDYD